MKKSNNTNYAYQRADIERATTFATEIVKQAVNAESGKELVNIRAELVKEMRTVSSAVSYAQIMYSGDLSSEFYLDELMHYEQNMPKLNKVLGLFAKTFLSSPHLEEALNFVDRRVISIYEKDIFMSSAGMQDLVIEEAGLITEYESIINEEFVLSNEKTVTIELLLQGLSSFNENVRKKSAEMLDELLGGVEEELGGIYSELIDVRTRISNRAGFDNFTTFGDKLVGRTRSRDEIAQFRADIASNVSFPQTEYHNIEINSGKSNQRITASQDKVIQAIFNGEGVDGAELFAKMSERGFIDIECRENKSVEGFCACLDDVGLPFIFMTLGGGVDDITLFGHEFGHALAYYKSVKAGMDTELLQNISIDIAEGQALEMEYKICDYIAPFVTDINAFKSGHINAQNKLSLRACLVDHFEQECYDGKIMSHNSRKKLWQKLENKYSKNIDYGTLNTLKSGARYLLCEHIFKTPLYYIAYAKSPKTLKK